ncbi:hypothetical protein D3C81_1790940 [compost metagenome]
MLDTQVTAGGGGEAGGKGQAQAQALFAGFGGEKRFEQVLARFGVDAVAVVTHAQAVFAIERFAFEPQLGLRLRLHGVEGVADQVDQNLLQAGLVDLHLHIGEVAV